MNKIGNFGSFQRYHQIKAYINQFCLNPESKVKEIGKSLFEKRENSKDSTQGYFSEDKELTDSFEDNSEIFKIYLKLFNNEPRVEDRLAKLIPSKDQLEKHLSEEMPTLNFMELLHPGFPRHSYEEYLFKEINEMHQFLYKADISKLITFLIVAEGYQNYTFYLNTHPTRFFRLNCLFSLLNKNLDCCEQFIELVRSIDKIQISEFIKLLYYVHSSGFDEIYNENLFDFSVILFEKNLSSSICKRLVLESGFTTKDIKELSSDLLLKCSMQRVHRESPRFSELSLI